MPENQSITNALSFDIEDWFHLVEIPSVDDPKKWPTFPTLVDRLTDWILAAVSDADVKATFFILGWIADRYPKLVRKIAEQGHELGTHSFWHRKCYELTPEVFAEDLRRSIDVIEQAGGRKVLGFRAPSFSITPGTEWAFDVMLDAGLKYDASLFPAPRGQGGYPCPVEAHMFEKAPSGRKMPELPMSVMRFCGKRLPFSGGGYVRLLPLWLIQRGFDQLNAEGIPAVVYLHPRDFAPECPRVPMGLKRRFKSYVGLSTTSRKLKSLLATYRFDTCSAVLGKAMPWITVAANDAVCSKPCEPVQRKCTGSRQSRPLTTSLSQRMNQTLDLGYVRRSAPVKLNKSGNVRKKYVFIQNEPFYLPIILDKYLREFADSTVGVNIQSVAQGKRTVFQTARDLYHIYGIRYFVWKTRRYIWRKLLAKIFNDLLGSTRKCYSVKAVARKYGVEVTQAVNVNSDEFRKHLSDAGVELIVSISGTQFYGKRLRDQTAAGIINCHGALLPRYAGLMPSFWTLCNNESEGGTTVHFVNDKIDNGPIVVQKKYRIHPRDTLEEVMARSKDLAAEAIIEAVQLIDAGNPPLLPNDATQATKFSIPNPEDTKRFLATRHRFY